MKCLKWLVEELHIKPCGNAIAYSLGARQYESVIYLLQYGAPINWNLVFNEYYRHKDLSDLSPDIFKKFEDMNIVIDRSEDVNILSEY